MFYIKCSFLYMKPFRRNLINARTAVFTARRMKTQHSACYAVTTGKYDVSKESKAFIFKIRQPKDNSLYFLDCLTLKVSALCSFETSVSTYPPTRSNIPGNFAIPTLTDRLCLSANNSEICLTYELFLSCQQCLWRHSSSLYRASLPTSPHSSLEHFFY